jgi:hypothetical protein
MHDLKMGQTVVYKDGAGYQGTIVAFYSNGVYSTQGEFAVIAAATNPFAGPHTIIHHSLLQIAPEFQPIAVQ